MNTCGATRAARPPYVTWALNSGDKRRVATKRHRSPAAALTSVGPEAGGVEFAHVELNPDDGKHDDGEEEQEADL